MSTTQERRNLMDLIEQACQSGARLHKACQHIGITCRTLQRWLRPCVRQQDVPLAPQQAQQQQEPQASVEAAPAVARASDLATDVAPLPVQMSPASQEAQPAHPSEKPLCADRRQSALRQAVTSHNKLTPQQCQAVLEVINSEEFKDLPPSQIVPRLADQGLYLASESTMQRLLRSRHQNTHRRGERPAKKRHKPFALKATVVHQVYTWDITYLPTQIKGQYFYLYVFVDIFSRFIVGAQVFESESAECSAEMIKDICERHGIDKGQVALHSDNGSPMRGQTMLTMMQNLGVIASRSRPSVSNDNPFSESLFRTLKYRPLMPVKPFESIEQARLWAIGLVDWYNQEHRHSAIGFVTPEQRHLGHDVQLLQKRTQLYAQARDLHPHRWSKNTRNWDRVNVVHLNPDKPDKPEFKESHKP